MRRGRWGWLSFWTPRNTFLNVWYSIGYACILHFVDVVLRPNWDSRCHCFVTGTFWHVFMFFVASRMLGLILSIVNLITNICGAVCSIATGHCIYTSLQMHKRDTINVLVLFTYLKDVSVLQWGIDTVHLITVSWDIINGRLGSSLPSKYLTFLVTSTILQGCFHLLLWFMGYCLAAFDAFGISCFLFMMHFACASIVGIGCDIALCNCDLIVFLPYHGCISSSLKNCWLVYSSLRSVYIFIVLQHFDNIQITLTTIWSHWCGFNDVLVNTHTQDSISIIHRHSLHFGLFSLNIFEVTHVLVYFIFASFAFSTFWFLLILTQSSYYSCTLSNFLSMPSNQFSDAVDAAGGDISMKHLQHRSDMPPFRFPN